ncbi:MAG: AMP-binding protein [Burkholderiales bacterium]|nr:AMP-binding protein [Burkholderiales bacterium]
MKGLHESLPGLSEGAGARAAARLWHGWGVRPGDRVASLGGNHWGQVVLLAALARIGAVLVPLNFRLAPAEWQRLLGVCTPRHIVHDAAWADAARALGLPAHAVEELDAPWGGAAAPVHAAEDAPVLLVFTSGTTGGPKAAVHTQGNLLANMRIAAASQRITASDVVLTVLPLFHVGGLCIQTLPALGAGARVLLHARFDPGEALAAIARDRPTLTLLVPAVMKAMIEHPRWPATDLSSLRAVWAGSSVLPAPLVQAFHARGVPVCNVYGATESGPFSIALPPEHAFDHAGSCGWPAPEVEARLVHGEVWLRGPNVVRHYWPDVPACDAEGWFHSGDLATQAADGSYTIVGRAKELIISGGENIHPLEVEQALAEHPSVAECAAFGIADAQWGEVVAVAVVRKAPVAEAELREHLAQRIARFKQPRRWFFVEALPKTALGKVQRGELVRLSSRA